MIGNKIGKWLVLSEEKVIQNRTAVFKHYKCQCECGEIKIVRADGLRNGRSTQCRKCRDKNIYIDPAEYIGKVIGKWTILKETDSNSRNRNVLCKCICGKEQIISLSRLKNNKTLSCKTCNLQIHGKTESLTYNTWRCMKARCTREKNENFKLYGGRGIQVCERWKIFENFLQDMGERPAGYQLDRINNDGDYEPNNCRWVTPKENSNNRRPRK